VSKADIIYEVPVEGGITRMMAVYQDISGVGVIGSVRSARHYFLDLAQGHDAVYIHAGGSPQAYSAISSRKIDNADGVNGGRHQIFYRDSKRQRTMGYEHSLVTSDELIAQYMPTYGFRLEHSEDFEPPYTFDDEDKLPGGQAAETFSVKFSGSKTTSFSYDGGEDAYLVSQHGKPYADGVDGVRVAAANVLVLETSMAVIAGDSAGRLNVDLTGKGAGYYMRDGEMVRITWEKKNASSPFVYTREDGAALTLRRGKTYICVTPTGSVNLDQ
jgi:hypothetical protein